MQSYVFTLNVLCRSERLANSCGLMVLRVATNSAVNGECLHKQGMCLSLFIDFLAKDVKLILLKINQAQDLGDCDFANINAAVTLNLLDNYETEAFH